MSNFNLLAYILPPDDKTFYHLFEASTAVCRDVSVLFEEIVKSGVTEERIAKAKDYKHKSSDLFKETLNELNNTFVTPIDREDIQLITTLLNKITKKIVKASMNLRVYRLESSTENMVNQAETLIEATKELDFIIHKFKKVSSIKEMTESNLRMKEIETKGDDIMFHSMDALFSGKYDALNVIKLRDIHKDIENALDTCYSVSDNVVNIVLKQS